MSGNSINFNDKKNKKCDFYKNKKTFNINDIDVNNMLISKKEKCGKYISFKHFNGYNDNNVIKPLYLELSQMIGYINKFNKNKIAMYPKVKDKKLLKITIKYGKKIEKLMEIDFNTQPTYGDDNDKCIKTKIKNI